jgi:hypothetical protein
MNYGTVQLMEDHGKPTPPPAGGYGAPDPAFMPDEIEQQILDFLDGKTHGEELLHALHDHVLDEPIPERMLVLFRQACSAEPEPTEAGAWSALSAARA